MNTMNLFSKLAVIIGLALVNLIFIDFNQEAANQNGLNELTDVKAPSNIVERAEVHQTLIPVASSPVAKIEQQRQEKQKDDRELIPVEKLDGLGIDLTSYTDAEILDLRKYLSNIPIYDDELPTQFRIYVRFILQESLLKQDQRNTYFADEQSATALDAYNPDIEYWKSVASDGDVAANEVLGEFYSSVGRHKTAEEHYQKVLINVKDRTHPLERLIVSSSWHDKKLTAAYLYYAEEKNINIRKNTHAAMFLDLKKEYSREEITEKIQDLKQTLEDLKVKYKNAEPTDLNTIFTTGN